ncbi:MAG: bifunctional 3-deoxy-7-phosphoheptulonate synthase/chorismate mutase [Acidobacteria bacterium]|nr:bifunctional 3-deoxy-7-phosphoheptulonate synthase/chorismate mutase [Acidobacteriota bacterium]
MGEQYKLVARETKPQGTKVRIGGVEVGGAEFIVMAGPCAVESDHQIRNTAERVRAAGARILRGGAFKPRTSPYSFQGLGEEGLKLLAAAGRATGLPVVTEVLTAEDVKLVAGYADALQVGARNMQNFALLKALGSAGRPIVLKRGLSSTIEELLMAAEYVCLHGNPHVILCERGIRTFETATRNTLDFNAVAVLKQFTHLPIIVDPSHGTGRRNLVGPVSKAAAAIGADGLIIEVHPEPETALSDGPQSLTPTEFSAIMRELAAHLALQGRPLAVGAGSCDVGGIDAHRERIDSIDEALVNLLCERVRIAIELGRLKRDMGYPIQSTERETVVVERAKRLSEGVFEPSAIGRLFRAIIEETRASEECHAVTTK